MSTRSRAAMEPSMAIPAAALPSRSGMLQRRCACGGTPGPTGECAACRRERPPGRALQFNLRIGRSDDRYEREADRVADRVMRMPGPQRPEPWGQHRVTGAGSGVPGVIHDVLRSPGQPLDSRTRTFMESRFGHDFGKVQIHADSQAAASAQALEAQAYTFGNHIVLGTSARQESHSGTRRILAHELAHVVQQRDAANRQRFSIGYRSDPIETEAERAATAVTNGRSVGVLTQVSIAMVRCNGGPIMSGMREPPTGELPGYSEWREAVFGAMISGLRQAQGWALDSLREKAAGLEGFRRRVAEQMIDTLEVITDIQISLFLGISAMVVGFVHGLIDLIIGLLKLIIGIIKGVALFLYGFFDNGNAFDEYAEEILASLRAIPEGLRVLVTNWLRRFEAASADEQTVMIGELTGEILAIIATFEVAAARAGSAPRLVVAVEGMTPRMALAGVGATTRAGTAVAIDVASPAAAAMLAGTYAMSIEASVVDLLGEGPESMMVHEATPRRAGTSNLPRHHVFPQEQRSFFETRGFDDIDDFCVELEWATHEAIHGGGNWRLGRTWSGEWNRRIMTELREAEHFMGRRLTRDEIITIGRELMVEYGIDKPFIPYR